MSENWRVPKNLEINYKPSVSLDCVHNFIRIQNDECHGSFDENELLSVFQPVYSLAHQRIVGYEALARVKEKDGSIANPSALFNRTEEGLSLTLLDRICRYLHLKRFADSGDSTNWLFLNVSPQVIAKHRQFGSFFFDLLSEIDFPPRRIVIEIVEHPTSDTFQLKEAVDYYKSLGCLIAIDDFGSGHSNFERIWTLKPDIVKLDQRMVYRASHEKNIRHLLPGIVSLLHQAGALVLIEGIETENQAMIAMESDADFVQGYFFSRPLDKLNNCQDKTRLFEDIFKKYQEEAAVKTFETQTLTDRYKSRFLQTIRFIKDCKDLYGACKILLQDSSIARAYLLKPDGTQVGETIHQVQNTTTNDPRFRPIQSAKSANWVRRHYLQRAVTHPNQLQLTRPYLSITGAHMCITLSMMFNTSFGDRVFCCDIIKQ